MTSALFKSHFHPKASLGRHAKFSKAGTVKAVGRRRLLRLGTTPKGVRKLQPRAAPSVNQRHQSMNSERVRQRFNSINSRYARCLRSAGATVCRARGALVPPRSRAKEIVAKRMPAPSVVNKKREVSAKCQRLMPYERRWGPMAALHQVVIGASAAVKITFSADLRLCCVMSQ